MDPICLLSIAPLYFESMLILRKRVEWLSCLRDEEGIEKSKGQDPGVGRGDSVSRMASNAVTEGLRELKAGMTRVIDGTIGAVSEVGSGRGVKRLLRRGLKIETLEAMEVTKIVERLVRVFRRFLSQNKTGSMMERMIT
jgi:hypothetical protein